MKWHTGALILASFCAWGLLTTTSTASMASAKVWLAAAPKAHTQILPQDTVEN